MTLGPAYPVTARQGLALALAGFMALPGCARHDEAELKARLSQWFSLGETLHFQSSRGCTAAIFAARSDQVKSALPWETDLGRAMYALRQNDVMALTPAGATPDDVFRALMNSDRAFGVRVQNSAVSARPCMDEAAQGMFNYALGNPVAVFVFDAAENALVLLDPAKKLVLFASGDG